MTRDEAVALLKTRLKRTADTAIDAVIVAEMQFAQYTILEGGITLPWFLLSEHLRAVTVVNEQRLVLPDTSWQTPGRTFLREYEEGALWVYQGEDEPDLPWLELKKDDYDSLQNAYPGTGLPRYYTVDDGYFYLFPTPDAEYQMRIRAYMREQPLSTNIENKWLKYAADWLIAETGALVAAHYLRDERTAQQMLAQSQLASKRVFLSNEARAHANRDYAMGDD